ncbi:MAG: ATP-grasp domain-containing protein [Ignavibacteriales bacterium]
MEGLFTSNITRCLDDAGISAVVMGLKHSREIGIDQNCAAFYLVEDDSFQQGTNLLGKIAEAVIEEKVDIIMPICVPSISFVANHADRLKNICRIAPVADFRAVQHLNNKWELYKTAQDLGVPAPKTIMLENALQARDIPFAPPMVSKPPDQMGALGVMYHNSDQQWLDRRAGLEYPVLLQEYVAGIDMCVSCYSQNGETIAVVVQQNAPGGLEFIEHKEAAQWCRQILKHLNYTGPSHFDFRLGEDHCTAKLLECNPRYWASVYAAKMAGINFPELAVRMAFDDSSLNNPQARLGWVPFKRNVLIRSPRLAVKQWALIKPFLVKYATYLRKNMVFEFYKVMKPSDPNKLETWFRFYTRQNNIRRKYRS